MTNDTLDGALRGAMAGDPAETAIEFDGKDVTWGDLCAVAKALTDLLDAAGIGESVPVGFIPRTWPGFAAALIGLIASRHSISMVYGYQSEEAIAADLRDLALPAYVADDGFWSEGLLAALPPGALAIGISREIEGANTVRLRGGDVAADRSMLAGPTDEPVVEMLTSGTTGKPSRLPTTYATIYGGTIAGNMMEVGSTTPPPAIVMFPFANISGVFSLLPYAAERRHIWMLEKFTVPGWLAFVRKHRPVSLILPPAGARMLLDADVPVEELACVKYVMMGSAALDRDTWKEFEAKYPTRILFSYGATEFAGAATAMKAQDLADFPDGKFGSVGRPVGRNQVRIVDAGNPASVLQADEEGLIEVLVPFLEQGWMRTNDLGHLDEDGFLFIHGRADGAINRGGFKIAPGRIEGGLLDHPGVKAACAVGIPDRRLGEVPVAAVEVTGVAERPDEAALLAFLRERIPQTHVPVAIRIVEKLPRTDTMKTDTRAMRELFADLVNA